jgi:hypothetical protein
MNLDEKFIKLSLSYLSLRKTVGWIGISLPFVLILGKIILFPGNGIPTSISHYYYTGMRDVMVGALCAVALFLFFYEGYDEWDEWLGNLAAIFALGAALFPSDRVRKNRYGWNNPQPISSTLFLMPGFVLTFPFYTEKWRTDPQQTYTKPNLHYMWCGNGLKPLNHCTSKVRTRFDIGRTHIDFWAECIALVAFGVSWLTKGGTLYPDSKFNNQPGQ